MQPDLTNQHSCCSNGACEISISQITASAGLCPASGSKGRRVDGATVKAMLAVSLTEVRDAPYFFCKDADCPVVYFSDDGTQTFTKDQIRERVYQKEPDSDDVFVCYCFRHTPGSIRAELIATGESTVVEGINAGIQAGQCACDIRNPQGSCCLGNVNAVVKAVQQTMKVEA
ncbi:MAG: copper chaperone Copz family protein [Anaerolineae bacterium]|nr:copper chaperone Copz family protein [Anaerolineae bacterium]